MSASLPRAISPQNGMVLLLCLIFLTALTLLGLSAASDTILQTQLSANLQEAERAKQSALAALSWAEDWLLDQDGPVPESCNAPCAGLKIHSRGALPPHPEFQSRTWWVDHGYEAGVDPLTGERITKIAGGDINSPLWMIETLHSIPPGRNATGHLLVWYRILARGSGQANAVVSVIESTVKRSWPPTVGHSVSGINGSAPCPGTESPAKCGRISWRELR